MPRTIGHTRGDRRSKAKKQADFLNALGDIGSITQACKKSRVPRSTIYTWLSEDKEFEKKHEEICQLVLGLLEDEAHRRAVEGTTRPIYQGGKKVGTIKEYSDTLLVVLLKARAPEKYRDRISQELTGKNGGPIKTVNTVVALSPEEIKNYSKALEDEV